MKSAFRPGLAGVLLLFAGAALCLVAIAQADLRFVPCHGYFRLDATEAYCRTPGYFAVAGIAWAALGVAALGMAL
jgi:hypothetical protein